MAQYLLSVHGSDTDPIPDDVQELYAAVERFNTDLRASGSWVFAGGLNPASTATVIDATGRRVWRAASACPRRRRASRPYGTIDELNSSMGFARSICDDQEIAAFTKGVQQDLFRIGSSLATPTESPKPQIAIDPALVDRLTAEVHRIEAIEGMLADWSIPGEHTAAAAFDMARTICRRAERALVRLQEAGVVGSAGDAAPTSTGSRICCGCSAASWSATRASADRSARPPASPAIVSRAPGDGRSGDV